MTFATFAATGVRTDASGTTFQHETKYIDQYTYIALLRKRGTHSSLLREAMYLANT